MSKIKKELKMKLKKKAPLKNLFNALKTVRYMNFLTPQISKGSNISIIKMVKSSFYFRITKF